MLMLILNDMEKFCCFFFPPSLSMAICIFYYVSSLLNLANCFWIDMRFAGLAVINYEYKTYQIPIQMHLHRNCILCFWERKKHWKLIIIRPWKIAIALEFEREMLQIEQFIHIYYKYKWHNKCAIERLPFEG